MQLAEKQRIALVQDRGEPRMRIEFDVWSDGRVSQWTHFENSADFEKVKTDLIAVHRHLGEFIKDERMCPFRKEQSDVDSTE